VATCRTSRAVFCLHIYGEKGEGGGRERKEGMRETCAQGGRTLSLFLSLVTGGAWQFSRLADEVTHGWSNTCHARMHGNRCVCVGGGGRGVQEGGNVCERIHLSGLADEGVLEPAEGRQRPRALVQEVRGARPARGSRRHGGPCIHSAAACLRGTRPTLVGTSVGTKLPTFSPPLSLSLPPYLPIPLVRSYKGDCGTRSPRWRVCGRDR
jgi:hypothetical protein